MNYDNVADGLTLTTFAGLFACVLAVPFYGFAPVVIACAALWAGTAAVKVLARLKG